MARKSRKNINNTNNTSSEQLFFPVFKNLTGIYARLSVEDNGYETNDSIQNQILFLKEYIEKNGDEFQLVHIYTEMKTAYLIQRA